jgi:tripartite-type tricarboxylate transporter receptor subunit TctC
MKSLFKTAICAVFAAAAMGASAQADFPNKPVKIVVPFAPGGASDAIARPLALAMSSILKQPVVVENKPGAAGNIALDLVARSPADGYTLLLGNISTNAMNQTSYAQTLKIVPNKDLAAVGLVGHTPSVLVASNAFAPKTAAEFIAYAKANPGKINYWLPGVASGPHFDMVQLEKHLNIKMMAVPFSGGAGPGMTALIGGQVDIGLINLGGALAQVKGGKLKALAVSTPQRLPDLPDVPTAAEAGLGALTSSWQALFVPSSTPRPVVQKLHAAMNEALGKPEVQEAIGKAATLIATSKSPEEAQAWVVGETNKWAKIITDSGVKPEQ